MRIRPMTLQQALPMLEGLPERVGLAVVPAVLATTTTVVPVARADAWFNTAPEPQALPGTRSQVGPPTLPIPL